MFHPSQVVTLIEGRPQTHGRIGGHSFPGNRLAASDDRFDALSDAVAALAIAISSLGNVVAEIDQRTQLSR